MKIRILGTILWMLGAVIRRIDVLHLGWYMMGTGRRRTLPLWAWAKTKRVDYNARGWFSPYVERRSPRARMLFNAMGKFKARDWIDSDNAKRTSLLDTYVFYATCSSPRRHGQNCGCPTIVRDWNSVTLIDIRWSSIPILRLREWLRNSSRLRRGVTRQIFGGIDCTLSYAGLNFNASDEYFAERGTPFYITGQVPEHVLMGEHDDGT